MPARPIRIGVQIRLQHAPEYRMLRDAVRRAEELGVDIALTWDHFFPIYGDETGPHFECWTTLAAWAECTERIQIGPLVSSVGYRNPDLLADIARTVDHISGGRLIMGLGSGWKEKDYLEYGYEFGTVGSRLDLLGESLERISRRWQLLNPPPVHPIPILIGGQGERKTLRMVARHASMWHALVAVEEYQHKRNVLAAHCAAIGRDPEEIEHWSEVPRALPIREGLAEADRLADAGVTTFTVVADGPDYDLSNVRRALQWRDARNGG